MRNLFSKSLMAAATVMMFASCSNDEEALVPENPFEGKTSDVTLVMSVKGSKASAEDVNMDADQDNHAKIKNVVVVPMIGDAYQLPIEFGDFDPTTSNNKTTTQTRTLAQSVNRFKVYGNATYGTLSETKVFSEGDLKMTVGSEVTLGSEGNKKTFYNPHALYYYVDTNPGGFYVATGSDFNTANWGDKQTDAVGANTLVKISDVNYAVGVIAALIKNGDNTTMFYDDIDLTTNGNNFGNRAIAPLTVTGITIAKQSQSFDANFAPSSDVVNVYETAAKTDIYKDDASVNNSNRDIANIYSVVAPTTEDNVTLNIEFEVAANTYFKSSDGNTVYEPGDKVYLPVVLNKNLATSSGTASYIFEADKATFLNAKVMNWGLVSEDVVETADVTIGVEFDVDWGEGLQFDVEI